MVEMGLRLLLAGVLAVAVVAKLANPREGRAGLETFGFKTPQAQTAGFWSLVLGESALAVGVALGSTEAAVLGAGLMGLFALVMAGAIAQGRAGAPCACFGAKSRVGWPAVVRNLALAAGFVAVAVLPSDDLSTDQWLGLGLVAALATSAALGAATLALAREIGLLRMRVGPASALDIPHEGPEVGSRTDLAAEIEGIEGKDLGVAVFTSAGCHICESLRPAVDSIAAHPAVALARFDEEEHRDAWLTLDIPGSPYAVALDRQGTVLSKGTFNNLAQLESILAAGERRQHGAEAAGV